MKTKKTRTTEVFTCAKCEKTTVSFNYEEHTYECSNCDYIEYAVPKLKYCSRCGLAYWEVTPFLPTSCQNCSVSFVD